jgi:hypothetical protein
VGNATYVFAKPVDIRNFVKRCARWWRLRAQLRSTARAPESAGSRAALAGGRGWGCGVALTVSKMRTHFTACRKRRTVKVSKKAHQKYDGVFDC